MNKEIIKLLMKITSISVFIVIFINIIWYVLNSNNWTANSENVYNFKNNEVELLSNVWVAVTTNIWTKFKQKQSNSYADSVTLEDIMSDPTDAKKDIIWRNMLLVKEYLNILKTDVPNLLNSDSDRKKSLEMFASELKIKYKLWTASVTNLTNQRDILSASIENSSKKIEDIKLKVSSDFIKFDSVKTWENIDEYLKVRKDYYYAKIYMVFVNKFIEQYDFLNNYNKNLLTVIVNNQDALIKNSYVVIPEEWNDSLKKLNLIYDETEYKAIIEKEMDVEK